MRWALTLDDTTESTALAEALGRAGVIIDDASPPVPMSGGEIVVYAAGPDPLPDGYGNFRASRRFIAFRT